MPVGQGSYDWLEQMGEDVHLFFHVARVFGFAANGDYEAPARSTPLAIAVSGGSDSLAMLHLFATDAARMGGSLKVVTVDHGLRPESAVEAAQVGQICAGLGLSHRVLSWDHGAILGNLQDQARRARYRLIADWARAEGISHVMIGHTADDQAETFLMGLSRAAGLDGLTGMRRQWDEAGVTFLRPLLGATRANLREYLTRRGVGWMDDPSNDNVRFARVKARRALQALEPLGITVDRLNETIQHLAQAQDGLRGATSDAWRRLGQEQAGALHIGLREFKQLAEDVQRRILLAAILWFSNDDYAPRGRKMFTLADAIAGGRDATLNGCRFRIKDQTLSIYREPCSVKFLECPTTEIWDKRWQMIGPHAKGLTIRALGSEGLVMCKGWRETKIPRDALLVSPAIWQKDALIAAPLAGFPQGWQAKLRVSLNESVLSH